MDAVNRQTCIHSQRPVYFAAEPVRATRQLTRCRRLILLSGSSAVRRRGAIKPRGPILYWLLCFFSRIFYEANRGPRRATGASTNPSKPVAPLRFSTWQETYIKQEFTTDDTDSTDRECLNTGCLYPVFVKSVPRRLASGHLPLCGDVIISG